MSLPRRVVDLVAAIVRHGGAPLVVRLVVGGAVLVVGLPVALVVAGLSSSVRGVRSFAGRVSCRVGRHADVLLSVVPVNGYRTERRSVARARCQRCGRVRDEVMRVARRSA